MEILKYVLHNIIQKPLRSLILILTGFICSLLLILSFTISQTTSREVKQDLIAKMTGHIKILKKDNYEFNYENDEQDRKTAKYLKTYLADNRDINTYFHYIQDQLEIQAHLKREFVNIIACDFTKDLKLKERTILLEGEYPQPETPYTCVIDETLQTKLRINVGDNIVLFISSVYGARNAMDFLVTGIYKPSAPWYENTCLIPAEDYESLTDLAGINSYYKIYVKNEKKIPDLVAEINANISTFEAKAYNDAGNTDASFFLSLGKSNFILLSIITLIIFTALMISMRSILIVNIFDRRKEIGTLRAIGFSRNSVTNIFLMELFINVIIGYTLALICVLALTLFFHYASIELPLMMLKYIMGMNTIKLQLDIGTVIFPLFILLILIYLMIIRTILKETERHAIQQLISGN